VYIYENISVNWEYHFILYIFSLLFFIIDQKYDAWLYESWRALYIFFFEKTCRHEAFLWLWYSLSCFVYICECGLVEDCINQIKAKKRKTDNDPGPIGNKALQPLTMTTRWKDNNNTFSRRLLLFLAVIVVF